MCIWWESFYRNNFISKIERTHYHIRSRINSARGIKSPLPSIARNIEIADKPLILSGFKKFVHWKGSTKFSQICIRISFSWYLQSLRCRLSNKHYHLWNRHPHKKKCCCPSRNCSYEFEAFLRKFARMWLQIWQMQAQKGATILPVLYICSLKRKARSSKSRGY